MLQNQRRERTVRLLAGLTATLSRGLEKVSLGHSCRAQWVFMREATAARPWKGSCNGRDNSKVLPKARVPV